jgi:hypothetical protein
LLALGCGGLLLCAGILLFVAAHWEMLAPGPRFALVLFLVAAFPVAGSLVAPKFRALSLTFHAMGTICVGAGIYLAAQIFNLQEHWPTAILLWALGAVAGRILVPHWSQTVMVALLLPAWLIGEWEIRAGRTTLGYLEPSLGLLLLAFTYLTARTAEEDSKDRQALAWIGGISILPCAIWAFVISSENIFWWYRPQAAPSVRVAGWILGIALPLLLAVFLRRKGALLNGAAAVWVAVIATFDAAHQHSSDSLAAFSWDSLGKYAWAGLGALGLVAWGYFERRRERVNLGVAGFALTVIIFYFSDVMDKLGRSASLIGMGVLFLFGGWSLERTRRRIVAHMERGRS